LEANQIAELFGVFSKEKQAEREVRIGKFMEATFARVFSKTQRNRLGFDVAASGQGDLAAIWVDEKHPSGRLMHDALLTCRTDDWNFLKTALWTFMRKLSAVEARGDETGLGRQICWETKGQFPNQFEGVNFSSKKHDMGFTLMNQLSTAEKVLSLDQAHDDIAQDFFSMRKTFSGGRWHFSEGRNNLNPASHCDMAWAGALASEADASKAVELSVHLIGDDD
jgi:phage FluMu gp28-like protein